MIKIFTIIFLIFFSATIFAADRFNIEQRNPRYRSGGLVTPTPMPGTSGKSRYRSSGLVEPTPDWRDQYQAKLQSSFNQNIRSGYTNTSKHDSSTSYDDKSYRKEYRLTPNSSRITEYNALTKTYRNGIKTYYTGGNRYIIKYDDGSIERVHKIGQNSFRVEQKDNLGNSRSGIQNSENTTFDDGFIKRSYKIGSGIRTNETGKK